MEENFFPLRDHAIVPFQPFLKQPSLLSRLASIKLHSSTLGLVLRRPDPYPPISILQYFQVIIWELCPK
jgi:hypothetical protein